MTQAEQRESARQFILKWQNKGREESDTQKFWLSLLTDVLGMEFDTDKVDFEKVVTIDNSNRAIDVYLPDTKVIIEQKSINRELGKKYAQSGGATMTPFEQAERYNLKLPYDERARWIVTSNFKEFWIYDMNKPNSEPFIIKLENLQDEYIHLAFLVQDKRVSLAKELEVSIKAGDIVGRLYDELLKQYIDPTNPQSLHSLNALCVRLVFCFYAEDSGLFPEKRMFHDYFVEFDAANMRNALIELFKVLDQKDSDRDPYLSEKLQAFPYVNGDLFADENIEIPQFNDKIRDLVLNKASEDFNWSHISPTIFGAVFESTLNPETRRSGGMHYTSVENIHKVIDPLFLDDLKEEFNDIKKTVRNKKKRLDDFHIKIANLKFLDPACGSGNFLTESYLSLRKIENDILRLKIDLDKKQTEGQIAFGTQEEYGNPIKVSIEQFYGIEINDFAVSVGKTALWIAESQMMKLTEDVVHMNLDFLPLTSYSNIVEGNALRMNWEDVVSESELNYIMGNPPFVGKKEQTKQQKLEISDLFPNQKGVGILDYVVGWYSKAATLIKNTQIQVAFVSTNSISQGEQPAKLWESLSHLVNIFFAYQTFIWQSEAFEKAAVHCVIIGFESILSKSKKRLFINGDIKEVKKINAYLVDAPNVLIKARNNPVSRVAPMNYGSMPIDNGALILSQEEREQAIFHEPDIEQYILPYYGGDEILKNKKRFCLWLTQMSPIDMKSSKFIYERISRCKEFRESSKRPQTFALAEKPYLFGEIRQPNKPMLVVPKVSSERRRYIPLAFKTPKEIINGSALFIPGADLYMMGILHSNVHNAWMRAVCGRMKSDYQYSNSVVYNNFPWPAIKQEYKMEIIKTGQSILDARNIYPESSLADLYDPLTMPQELRKAHLENDKAVMRAYGFPINGMSESDCVARLMEMYQELTN